MTRREANRKYTVHTYVGYNNRSCYQYYKKNRKYKDKRVNWLLHRAIMQEFYQIAAEKILEGETFQLYFGLGSLAIEKKKNKRNFYKDGRLMLDGIPIDWPATEKLIKEKPHLKEKHFRLYIMSEYTYRIKWYKIDNGAKNIGKYRFIAVDRVRKKLVQRLRDNNDYYIKVR